MGEMIPTDQGRLRLIDAAPGAVNLEMVLVMDPRTRWRLMAVFITYVADAGGGARRVELIVTVGGAVVMQSFPSNTISGGLSRRISFAVWGSIENDVTSSVFKGEIPSGFLMNNEAVLGTNVAGMEAGDQITVANVLVEEWIEPLV